MFSSIIINSRSNHILKVTKTLGSYLYIIYIENLQKLEVKITVRKRVPKKADQIISNDSSDQSETACSAANICA